MLKSRIKEHALAKSIDIKFAKNLEELKTYIESGTIKRIIVDLTAGPEFANSFAAILNQRVESWGVIAHIDLDTQEAALGAGFTKVIPRSVLVKDLADIIC